MDEVVVIRIRPYQEANIIMTCFSKGCGLIQIFTSVKSKIQALSHAKVSLWQKGHGFFYLRESGLVEPHLSIRADFEKLKAAGMILRVIEKSQFGARKSSELFNMLISYLSILKVFPNPKALGLSFAYKVLAFEGILDCQELAKSQPLIKTLTDSSKFEHLLDIQIETDQEQSLKQIIEEALKALT